MRRKISMKKLLWCVLVLAVVTAAVVLVAWCGK